MNINELLAARGLSPSGRRQVKLLRHKDSQYDVHALARAGHLNIYQGYQARPILNCDTVVAFLGGRGTRATFQGVFRVIGMRTGDEVLPAPATFPHPELAAMAFHYDLEPVPGFEDLEDRVVIEWGNSAVSWHQWLDPDRPKEVIEVLPTGYVGDFPGYENILLSHNELCRLIANPDANRTWLTLLRAVAGVYLIVDSNTGRQYIGSAYGQDGVLGRWHEYARNSHGGNQLLRNLLKSSPSYANHFQYSILCTLPGATNRNEVLAMEALFKRKLGSRSFGLNAN